MTILIKNVQVIDGIREEPLLSDVLIKNERISAIGTFNKKVADTVIDGGNAYLAPGFIDVNTDSDHYLTLFSNPGQQDFLLQGVTTIIGGHCGSSLAPLLYGGLESVRKWADTGKINVDWKTVDEFLRILENRTLGVNFGTLVGHSTIRRAMLGETLRDLTQNELKVFQDIIKKSMEEGAFGLSTGLGYAHGRQTPYVELKILLETVSQHGGIYATHLRNEESGLFAAVGETISLAKDTGVATLIDHFRPLYGFEEEWERSLDSIEENSKIADIHCDLYPFDQSLVPIYTLLPLWAQNGGIELMLNHLKTPAIREKILKALPRLNGNEITIAAAPGNEYMVHKTLRDFCETRGIKSTAEGLLSLMDVVGLKAVLLIKNINIETVIKNLFRKPVWIASNSASFGGEEEILKPKRATETFTAFLGLIKEKREMSLGAAIKKITSEPAQKFNIKDRGTIREGAFADLVIFSEERVRDVLINGNIAVRNGEIISSKSGKVLRKS